MEPIRSSMSMTRVIGTTLRVFADHLGPMLAVGTLPFLPALGLLAWLGALLAGDAAFLGGLRAAMRSAQPEMLNPAPLSQGLPLALLAGGVLLGLLGTVVSCVAATRIVCDACEGRTPSLKSALRAGIGMPAVKTVATTLLGLGGMALALAPMVLAVVFPLGGVMVFAGPVLSAVLLSVVLMNLLFAPPAVVAEGKWGVKALRRSAELAWGRNWRNLGVYLAMAVLTLLVGGAVSAAMRFVPEGLLPGATSLLLPVAVELGMTPLFFVMVVVLYYDMRARNGESFGPMPKGKAFPDPPKLQQDGHSFGALPPKSRMRVAGRGGGTRDM